MKTQTEKELIELLHEVQGMFIHQDGETKSNKVKTAILGCQNVCDTMNKIRQTLWNVEKRFMKSYEVTDIKYDTDGKHVSLPATLTIAVPDDYDADQTEEFISDEISNRTGFCHNGFATTPEIRTDYLDQEREELIDAVIDEIDRNRAIGENESIVELLSFIPDQNLLWFLNEDDWVNFPKINSIASELLFTHQNFYTHEKDSHKIQGKLLWRG